MLQQVQVKSRHTPLAELWRVLTLSLMTATIPTCFHLITIVSLLSPTTCSNTRVVTNKIDHNFVTLVSSEPENFLLFEYVREVNNLGHAK